MRVTTAMLGTASKRVSPMDAISAGVRGELYAQQSPVLIAGDSDLAIARATRTVEASGLRIAAALPIGEAPKRIELQASASAVWIELGQDGGSDMDRLVAQVNDDAR